MTIIADAPLRVAASTTEPIANRITAA